MEARKRGRSEVLVMADVMCVWGRCTCQARSVGSRDSAGSGGCIVDRVDMMPHVSASTMHVFRYVAQYTLYGRNDFI